MKKLGFLDKVIYIINVLVALVLLLSYLLPFLSPKTFAVLSVISLAVPILIIVNIVFFLFWLVRFKRQFFLSLVVLLIGFKYVGSLYKFSSVKNETAKKELSVLSYNVRLFNLYEWIKEDHIPKKIVSLVKKADADVFCVQEYRFKDVGAKLDFYPYQYVQLKERGAKTGLAIYSKYKIVNKGSLNFSSRGNNNAIYVDILKGKDTVRVYNVHLESLHINPDVEELTDQDSEKLFKRIGNAFKRQQSQAEILNYHKEKCRYQKIICGDFNNTAYSYVYKGIKDDDMIDTFEAAGNGFGKTFDFKFFPLRIDFILADETFEVLTFKNYEEQLSDHYPIYSKLALQ